MDGENRFDPDALTELLDHASSAPFVALVRRIERMLVDENSVGVGGNGPVQNESVRFRHDPSLAFQSADVSRARWVEAQRAWSDEPGRGRVEVTTTFLGVTGASSPLPSYVAEEIAQEDDEKRPRRDFLDIFHHRLVSLLYRGLARVAPHAEFRSDASDAHSRRLLALAGVDASAEARAGLLTDRDILRLVPIVAPRRGTRHAIEASIRAIFADVLGDAKIEIAAARGEEVEFDAAQRVSLGRRNTRLGTDMYAGRRIHHAAGRIVIVIGPIGSDAHRALSRGGELAAKLRAVIDFAADLPIEVDIEFILHEEARRTLALDGTSRLGRDSFLAGGRGTLRVQGDRSRSSSTGRP